MPMISVIDDKYIQGIELEDSIFNGEKVVGSFIKNSGILKLININKEYNSLENTDITINDFGTWHVEKLENKQESVSTTAKLYDYSYKFDSEYETNTINFPCTLIQWVNAICTKVGVVCGSTIFPNSTYIMTEQPYLESGATYRDAIKMIAEAAGCFAKVDRDDKLYIKWFENINIDIEDWFSLEQLSERPAVNTVVLGRGDVEDNIKYPTVTPTNPYELRIDNNQILYFNREDMIVNIYNQVNGFKFYPFKMRTDGRLNLKSGMKVTYTDLDGMTISTYVMYHRLVLNGGVGNYATYTSYIESYELKETSTKYQYAGTLQKKIKNAEISVDKINGEITSIVEEIGDRTDKTTSLTQDVETLTAQVHNVVALSNTVTGHSVELTDCANLLIHELKITGDIERLFPRIGLFPRVGLFPRDMCLVVEKPSGPQKIRLPFNKLEYVNADDCDVFQILDGKASITRRNGTIETYTDIFIELEEGTNTLRMENLSNANLEATYLYKNDYTENFSTKAETMAQIKLSEAQINLEVSEKVGRDEMSSAIELATDEINLEVSEKVGRDEMSSAIELATDEINLEVNKKVGKTEIISRINQSAEAIQILASKLGLTATNIINLIAGNSINLTSKNITINSTNFNADKNGNVTCNNINCNNGTFKGNVLLGDNSSIIGTNGGLLQTITCKGEIESYSYSGASSMHPMGYSLVSNNGQGTITTSKDRLKFEVLIPKNFLVKSAHIVLSAMPANFTYYDDEHQLQQISGYVRNMKLYKATSFSGGSLDVDLADFSTMQESGITYEQIANAFGSSGFTGSSNGYTEQVSIDIKSHIQTSTTENKNNMLKIETGNAPATTISAMYSKSGGLAGTLIINGYTNFE